MKPINKWSHTERDPHIHYYFFLIYVKDDGSQLYAQLFKHALGDKIVIQIRDAVAISAKFFESDKKEIKKLLDKYYEQNKITFEQTVISRIFRQYTI